MIVVADVFRRRISLPVKELSDEDQALLTKVVHMAELVGKPVIPLVIPTDNPFDALTRVARAIHARELVVGASHRQSADRLFDQVTRPWEAKGHDGESGQITIRILGPGEDQTRTVG